MNPLVSDNFHLPPIAPTCLRLTPLDSACPHLPPIAPTCLRLNPTCLGWTLTNDPITAPPTRTPPNATQPTNTTHRLRLQLLTDSSTRTHHPQLGHPPSTPNPSSRTQNPTPAHPGDFTQPCHTQNSDDDRSSLSIDSSQSDSSFDSLDSSIFASYHDLDDNLLSDLSDLSDPEDHMTTARPSIPQGRRKRRR